MRLYILFVLMFSSSTALSQGVTFSDLAPILSARCAGCHSGPRPSMGLRLDTLGGLLKGSRNGPVVHAGDVEGSELIRRLKGYRLPRMPLSGPPFLTDAEIALFEIWIETGMRQEVEQDLCDRKIDASDDKCSALSRPVMQIVK
jgi:hypothetical protein